MLYRSLSQKQEAGEKKVADRGGVEPHTRECPCRFSRPVAARAAGTIHEVVVLTGVEPVHPGLQSGTLPSKLQDLEVEEREGFEPSDRRFRRAARFSKPA